MADITFSDVLIEPQYSEVTSRSLVDVRSNMGKFTLRSPVISTNMCDITGEKMCVEMFNFGGLAILHRFMSIEDNIEMVKNIIPLTSNNGYVFGVSIGVKEEEKKRFYSLYDRGLKIFCIDQAHGHCVMMKNMIQWIRKEVKDDVYIIAGNIATGKAVIDITSWGADCCKVGIGPGCFVKSTKILTSDGYKNIEDIKIGDLVFTHKLRFKKVICITNRLENKKIYKINNIKCTENHEFYVLNKKYLSIVNDENINEYAQWKRADELTKNYVLLKK